MRANESLGSGSTSKISINGGQELEGSLCNFLMSKDNRRSPEEGGRRDTGDHKQRLRTPDQTPFESTREFRD